MRDSFFLVVCKLTTIDSVSMDRERNIAATLANFVCHLLLRAGIRVCDNIVDDFV